MNDVPFVSIVILNYNRAIDTINCIKSINDIDYPNYRIILIDNCSTDNSIAVLRKQLENVEIFKTEKNIEFARR